MKKTIILFVFILVSVSQARIWRVEQNTAIQADYRNLQTALNDIPAGDTVLVSGYVTGWGNIEIKKPVVIIGPGFFLDQYYNSTVNQYGVQIGQVIFSPGGENSEMMGCFSTQIAIRCNNITIKRNYVYGNNAITATNIRNIIIQQNYINSINTGYCGILIQSCDNLIIRNNYVSNATKSNALSLSGNSSGFVTNNVFYGTVYVEGVQFNNNILFDGYFSSLSTILQNNFGPINNFSFGSANGNKSNVDMSTVFIGTGTTDGKWQLKDGSPAKGAGVGGTDCGMFGGDFPYVLSGIPPIPTIYDAIVPATGNSRDGLPIRIKARANK